MLSALLMRQSPDMLPPSKLRRILPRGNTVLFLARRPGERTSGQKMEMHVKDFLSGSGTVVEDKPKGIRNIFLIRNNFV